MNNQESVFDNVVPVFHGNVQDANQNGMVDLVARGETMLQQKSQYCTAIQVVKPRQLKLVQQMVLSEVELEPESCYYSWDVNDRHSPTGKKTIIGATIGLEMSIARNFGNCAIDIEIQEQPDAYIFIPAFLDLESGFTFRRAFRQNRVQDIGKKYDPERAEDMRFQIGQSKAIRNVIRNATPKALTNTAIDRARDLVRDHITADGIEKTREKVLSGFKLMNIELKHLAEYTGIPDPAKWNIDVLERLITLGKALKNGDIMPGEAFPNWGDEEKKPDTKAEPKPDEKKSKKKDEPAPETPKDKDGLFSSPIPGGDNAS
jgi:hypothetical protein